VRRASLIDGKRKTRSYSHSTALYSFSSFSLNHRRRIAARKDFNLQKRTLRRMHLRVVVSCGAKRD